MNKKLIDALAGFVEALGQAIESHQETELARKGLCLCRHRIVDHDSMGRCKYCYCLRRPEAKDAV